ncbi:IL23A protein, partial [Rhinopomastus cyanomelas]|nr:IL23A protein [Rhinopomastus cyanomelas]
MDLLRCLRLCLCLPLLLPPPADPAPALTPTPTPTPAAAPVRIDWAACRSLSRELAGLVATVKEPHRVLDTVHLSDGDLENWPPRIRCSDACDPATLDTNNTRCLHRILQGLQQYRDLLGSDIFRSHRLPRLEAALDQLLGLVQQEHGRTPGPSLAPSEGWARSLLQHQALQRLQSFAAVMSRVFTHSAK